MAMLQYPLPGMTDREYIARAEALRRLALYEADTSSPAHAPSYRVNHVALLAEGQLCALLALAIQGATR